MNTITIRLIGAEEFDLAMPFLFPTKHEILDSIGVVLIAECNGEICGALGALPCDEYGNVSIVSLFVAEEHRQKGVASALLDEISQRARDTGLSALLATYSCSEADELTLHTLFSHQGFDEPHLLGTDFIIPMSECDTTFFASLASLGNRELLNVFSFNELNQQSIINYQKIMENNILPQVEEMEGTFVPELSFAYIVNSNISCVLLVELLDDTLHIANIYLENTTSVPIMVFLLKHLINVAAHQYSYLKYVSITAHTEKSRVGMEKLMQCASLSCIRRYAVVKPLAALALMQTSVGSHIFVHCNSLINELGAREISAEYISNEGFWPFVNIHIPSLPEPITIDYSIQSDPTSDVIDLQLDAIIQLPISELPLESQKNIVDSSHQLSGPGVAIFPEESTESILFYAQLDLGIEFDAEVVIDSFLIPYIEKAKKCFASVIEKTKGDSVNDVNKNQ